MSGVQPILSRGAQYVVNSHGVETRKIGVSQTAFDETALDLFIGSKLDSGEVIERVRLFLHWLETGRIKSPVVLFGGEDRPEWER